MTIYLFKTKSLNVKYFKHYVTIRTNSLSVNVETEFCKLVVDDYTNNILHQQIYLI